MVLAAGLGTRMRPLTDRRPKPLVEVGGKALIDHVLDRLADAGVERAVVNVHYLAEQIERHLAARTKPQIVISDERGDAARHRRRRGQGAAGTRRRAVLPSQFRHALDRRREAQSRAARRRLRSRQRWTRCCCWRPTTGSIGYAGRGDFAMAPDGRLRARGEREVAPFVYAGAAILSPALFADAPQGEFPLTDLFDRAAEAGRLYGLRLEGLWMHVGTPDAIAAGGSRDQGAA